MPATCYRCITLDLDPIGEPFGVCSNCSIMACRTCGNRLRKAARFRCRLCYPETVLLPSGGLAHSGEPPGGGEPSEPFGGGPSREEIFLNTGEWERLESELAELTADDRAFFHEGALALVFERAHGYAFDEARREDLNAEVGWEVLDEAEEQRRRAEALVGAQLLARGLQEARASETLRPELLADAFGVACWAIGVRAGRGEIVSEERLALLADLRLRFVIGTAMPVIA